MTARSHRDLPSRTLEDIRIQLEGLLNQRISVKKRNRGKDVITIGRVAAVYSNLFVFEIERNESVMKKTYTFTDILSEGITIEKVD